MGFGSYDETEQELRQLELDDEAGQRVTGSGFDGTLAFESGADTDDLLATLGEIKAAREASE